MTDALLIIIDPQNDFTHPKGYYAKKHREVSEITRAKEKIINLFDHWNRDNTVVVYSNYRVGQFKPGVKLAIPGTFGHKVDTDFYFDHHMTHIAKTEHSAFSSDVFKEYVQLSNKTTLVICGFLAEYCVKQTALDALLNKYKIYLVEDCIATGDDVAERKQQMITELKTKGAEIVDSDFFLTSAGS
jgi:nicotinamidase/pyrazinamidase